MNLFKAGLDGVEFINMIEFFLLLGLNNEMSVRFMDD